MTYTDKLRSHDNRRRHLVYLYLIAIAEIKAVKIEFRLWLREIYIIMFNTTKRRQIDKVYDYFCNLHPPVDGARAIPRWWHKPEVVFQDGFPASATCFPDHC